MLAVQVNTLQGCEDQPFCRIYYALGEIKAIDCLQQGHNKVPFSTERGLSLVATTLGHHLAIPHNKVNQICGGEKKKQTMNCLTSTKDTER